MTGVVPLMMCFILFSDSSAVWLANHSVYKSKNVLPIPIEMVPAVSLSIAKGAKMALQYCQRIFKWDKWNCPISYFQQLPKQEPNRETAFSKAILAAGIVHTITRDCSKGDLSGCGCDPNFGPPSTVKTSDLPKLSKPLLFNITELNKNYTSDWYWGGCSDHPKYALMVTKNLFDDLEKGNDAANYVGRHNNMVGREIILETMVKRCRCHGVSGSCSLQTCWMQVAPFEEVTRMLKERYRKAERLTYDRVEVSVTLGNSVKASVEEKAMPARRNKLLYLKRSPDYCLVNATQGFPGTRGRQCSRTTSEFATRTEKRSCRSLCRECGHKVKAIRTTATKKCNCEFLWCCEVNCDTCVVDVEEYVCD